MHDRHVPGTTRERLAHLEELREAALSPADERSVERQRARGKGLAQIGRASCRERV